MWVNRHAWPLILITAAPKLSRQKERNEELKRRKRENNEIKGYEENDKREIEKGENMWRETVR